MADKGVVWKPHPQMMCKKRHQSQLPHTSAILNHPCDVGINGLPLLQPACHHGPLATQSLSRKWKANCDNWKPNDSVLRNFLSRITGTIDHDLFPAIPRKSSIWSQPCNKNAKVKSTKTQWFNGSGSLVQPPTAKVPLCACWISSTILCKLPNLPEHLLNLLCWASVCWHTSGHYCGTCLHTRFRGSTCTEKTWQIFVLFQNTMR